VHSVHEACKLKFNWTSTHKGESTCAQQNEQWFASISHCSLRQQYLRNA